MFEQRELAVHTALQKRMRTNEGEGMNRRLNLFPLLALVLAGALSSPAARAQDAPHRVEITAKKFSFDPPEITVKKGEPVLLVLKSADVGHGIRIRELNVQLSVKAGQTGQVQFTPQNTGDFVGKCSVFCGSGHGHMALKLHVVE
jgi:cytochrome c oxidase subunit II